MSKVFINLPCRIFYIGGLVQGEVDMLHGEVDLDDGEIITSDVDEWIGGDGVP